LTLTLRRLRVAQCLQLGDRTLRGGVGGDSAAALEAEQARHLDDPSPAAVEHEPAYLAELEDGWRVDGEHGVEVGEWKPGGVGAIRVPGLLVKIFIGAP
jgi:hypothetical protein